LRSIALSSQATAQNTDPTAAAARAAADQQAQAMADMMARALGYYWGYVKDEQVAVALRA
jgi:hypothetical protein